MFFLIHKKIYFGSLSIFIILKLFKMVLINKMYGKLLKMQKQLALKVLYIYIYNFFPFHLYIKNKCSHYIPCNTSTIKTNYICNCMNEFYKQKIICCQLNYSFAVQNTTGNGF